MTATPEVWLSGPGQPRTEPPHPPDFAGLVSLYCNHLACVIAPRAPGIARLQPSDSMVAIGHLTFLALAAANASTVMDYCVKLPAVERHARGDALAACYREGERLCTAFRGITL